MPFTTLSQGLTIKVPTVGTRNWGPTTLTETWSKISAHDHSGGGMGKPITAIGANVGYTQASTLTPAGTTQTVAFTNGNIQYLSLASATGDVTLTLANPVAGATYRIWVTQGATARDLIWPGTVKWPQGQKPILSTTNGAVDMVELFYTGSAYRGTWELDFQ